MSGVFEVKVSTRDEGEEVLDRLNEIADQYGKVSVSDLYDLVGIQSVFTDTRFGWQSSELRSTFIRRTRGGYAIMFPQVLNLKSTHNFPVALSAHNLGKPITVTSWQLDARGVSTGEPDTYVGTLEGFWSNKEGLIIKLHGFDSFDYPKHLFRVEVSVYSPILNFS